MQMQVEHEVEFEKQGLLQVQLLVQVEVKGEQKICLQNQLKKQDIIRFITEQSNLWS